MLIKSRNYLSALLLVLPLANPASASDDHLIRLKILGINDFHGQISTGRFADGEAAGGAAVLASYLKEGRANIADNTIITLMGDLVGASPPESALLNDEPSIVFINSLANAYCTSQDRMNPQCNIVATLGNHEFDQGQKSLFDLIYGTNKAPTEQWYPSAQYQGAVFPYISANIISEESQRPLFPPYVIKQINGISIAFVGAILKDAAALSFPANVKGIKFLDEAEAINTYLPEIKAQGADIVIVLIHEGGTQKPYEGPTQQDTQVNGAIKEIIYHLNDEVDVVMAGHTHQFLNAFLPNHHGKQVLVTQANSYSTSFSEITLDVDAENHQLKNKTARIITSYANHGFGKTPDAQTQELVRLAEDKVAPIIQEPIGTNLYPLLIEPNAAGESNFGNLVADAYKTAMGADLAFQNLHGIRADISEGTITKGTIYAALPFTNRLLLVSLTGQDIYDVLEQQWEAVHPNILQISGISYSYDERKPLGKKIQLVQLANKPLIKEQVYTVALTDYLASGSGVFSVLKRSKILKHGDMAHQVLIDYIKSIPQPVRATIDERIKLII